MCRFWREISYIFPRRDLYRFSVLLGILIINAFLEILALSSFPAFTSVLLSAAEENSSASGLMLQVCKCLGAESTTALLWYSGGILLTINIIRAIWVYLSISLQARMLGNRRVAISGRLLTSFINAPADFWGNRNSGDLINRVVNDTERFITVFLTSLLDIIQHATVFICITVFLLYMMPAISLIALISLGIFGGGFILLRGRHLKRLGAIEQRSRSLATTYGMEAIGVRQEAKIGGTTDYFLQRFHRVMEEAADARRRSEITQRFVWPYLELVSMGVLLILALAVFIYNGRNLAAVVPQFTLLGIALIRLRSYGINIMVSYSHLRYHYPAMALITKDLQDAQNACEAEFGTKSCQFQREIRLENLSFAYPGSKEPVLRQIDFTIRKGESLGIVGETGCGKSTLLQLLLGFLKPTDGRITVDDCPALPQNLIGYVPQNIFLLDDTLAANIALGVEPSKRDQEALQQALSLAQLSDFVANHPDGMEMNVGEGGGLISGGQRQRIGIARALYHHPQILCLDEATSALDNHTSSELTTALEQLRGKCTTIIVAHQLNLLRNCDRLIVLERGKVASCGSYDELLATSAPFQRLACMNPAAAGENI